MMIKKCIMHLQKTINDPVFLSLDDSDKIFCLSTVIKKICLKSNLNKSVVVSDFVYQILKDENADN